MTALQQFLDRLKINVAAIAIAALCAFSQMAQAKTTITLQDNIAISFLSGQLDPIGYQGEIFDVEFYEDGALFATAGRVLVKSEGTPEETDFVIQQFEIDNLEVVEESTFMTVQSVRARNFYIGWFVDDVTSPIGNPSVWRQATIALKHIEIMDEEAGVTTSIPHFAMAPFEVDRLSNGKALLTSWGFEMPSMKIAPLGYSPAAIEFRRWLDAIELPNLDFSLLTQQNNTIQGADIVSNSLLQTRIAGIFDLALRFELHTSEDAFSRLSDPNLWDEDDKSYFSYFIAKTRLGGFNIMMRDLGLLALLQETGEIPPYFIVADQLNTLITSFLPETGQPLANAMGKFLQEGGSLELSAKPQPPFKVENFGYALLMPDLVVREINLQATHTP